MKQRKKEGAKRFGVALKALLWSPHRVGNGLRLQQSGTPAENVQMPCPISGGLHQPLEQGSG